MRKMDKMNENNNNKQQEVQENIATLLYEALTDRDLYIDLMKGFFLELGGSRSRLPQITITQEEFDHIRRSLFQDIIRIYTLKSQLHPQPEFSPLRSAPPKFRLVIVLLNFNMNLFYFKEKQF
jgi:hypothetical protein